MKEHFNLTNKDMRKQIRNYVGAVASLFFGLMNFSSFGYSKEPFFLFGGIVGFIGVIAFFTIINEE
jgi:hypothetical protein